MSRLRTLTLLLAATLGVSAYAQSDAVVSKRATELREAPAETARSLGALPAQTPLTRLPLRQGAWIQVRTAVGATGWVHMFDLGSASAPSNSAASALRGLTKFFDRGSQGARTTTATSTLGIRGLGSEDIAQAQPNLAALAHADTFRQSAAQARQFAVDARLRTWAVEDLPAPPAPQALQADSSMNTRQVP